MPVSTPATVEQMLAIAETNVAENDGRFSVSFNSDRVGKAREWMVGIEWGHEAPDSPMVGAAAYATGPTLQDALSKALGDAGWL